MDLFSSLIYHDILKYLPLSWEGYIENRGDKSTDKRSGMEQSASSLDKKSF